VTRFAGGGVKCKLAEPTMVLKFAGVGAAQDGDVLGPGRPRAGLRQVEHDPAYALRRAESTCTTRKVVVGALPVAAGVAVHGVEGV